MAVAEASSQPTETRSGPAPARLRAAGAVLALVLAYLGLLLGVPTIEIGAGRAPTLVQAQAGGQHVAPREGQRAVVVAERPDPRAPAPPPSVAFAPHAAGLPPPALASTAGPARPAAHAVRPVRDRAHPPRAPPSAAA